MIIKLSPKELKPGIIAIEAVVTPSGQILAPAMTELTRQIINKMKLYKVEFASVDSEDPIVRELLRANAAPAPVVTPVAVPVMAPVMTPTVPVAPAPVPASD